MKTRLLFCVMLGFGLVCVLFAVLNLAVVEDVVAAPTTTRCVNPGGTPPCYASIQAAVNASIEHDVITVSSGTYYEHIYVDKNLELLGEGWGSTTIDGGYTGPTATMRIKWGIDSSTIISGFKITGGGTGITSTSTNNGGGISMDSASPKIINTWIDNCTAQNGGGVFVNGGSPTFENVPVWNSKAAQRGGAYYAHEAEVTISGNIFEGTNGTIWWNRAAWDGGGIYFNDVIATIIGLRIWWNVSDLYGGGLYLTGSTPYHIYANSILWNSAKSIGYAGGGIYTYDTPNLDIFLNDISGNNSPGTGGGALFNQSGGRVHWNFINNNRVNGQSAHSAGTHILGSLTDLTMNNNEIKGNISTNHGGGLGIGDNAAPRIDSNVIVSNSIGSGCGAGLMIDSGAQVEVYNNIIARNTITTSYKNGSGAAIFGSPVKFINNTIAENYVGGIYLLGAENAILENNIIAENADCGLEAPYAITYTITTDYNDLWSNDYDYCYMSAATHDVSVYPDFLVANTDNMFNRFHVESSSSVADLGDPSLAPLYDIDGLFRGLHIWLGVDEHGEQYNLYAPVILR